MALSDGGKLGCLLKIAMLKRIIDVTLGNGGETQGDTELVSLPFISLLQILQLSPDNAHICLEVGGSAGEQQGSHCSAEGGITEECYQCV